MPSTLRARRRRGGSRVSTGRGRVVAAALRRCRRRRPRGAAGRRPRRRSTPTAIAPAWIRNPRRDQSGVRRRSRPAAHVAIARRPAVPQQERQHLDPGDARRRARRSSTVVGVAAGDPQRGEEPGERERPEARPPRRRTTGGPRRSRGSAPMSAATTTIRTLEGELVVRAEQPDDEVLGAGRLVVDDELADRGEERRRAEEAGDELRQADRRERADGAGDRRPEAGDRSAAPSLDGRVAGGRDRVCRSSQRLFVATMTIGCRSMAIGSSRARLSRRPHRRERDPSRRPRAALPRRRRARARRSRRAASAAARSVATRRTASPGRSWPSERQVGRDHDRRHAVAAGRLVIGAEDDRPAVRRDLDRAPGHAMGQRLAADPVGQRRDPRAARRRGRRPRRPAIGRRRAHRDRARAPAGRGARSSRVGRPRRSSSASSRARRAPRGPVPVGPADPRRSGRRHAAPGRQDRRTRRRGRSSASRARAGRRSRRRRPGRPRAAGASRCRRRRELTIVAGARSDGCGPAPGDGRRRIRAPRSAPASPMTPAVARDEPRPDDRHLERRGARHRCRRGGSRPRGSTGPPRRTPARRDASSPAGRRPGRSSAARRRGPRRTSSATPGRTGPAAPGRRSAGSGPSGSNSTTSVRPIRFQPPGIDQRVDAGLLPGDADAPRRDALARAGAARRDEGRRAGRRGSRTPGRTRGTGRDSGRRRVELDDVRRAQAVELGDLVEVRAVGAAVADGDLDRRRDPRRPRPARSRAAPIASRTGRRRSRPRASIASGSNGTRTEAWAGTARPTPEPSRGAASMAARHALRPRPSAPGPPVAEGHEHRRVAERLDRRLAGRDASSHVRHRRARSRRSRRAPAPRRTACAISTASGLSPWTQIVSARTATSHAVRRP